MITVCILTKNSERTLEKTLQSTQVFDEVLLLDNGSTDQTLAIASKFPNVQVHHCTFLGFGKLRNLAATLAKHDWILALDSDEVLSKGTEKELSILQLDPHVCYTFARHNFFNGKRIYGCGWGNEYVARLYHKNHCIFSEDQVHETLIFNASKSLNSPLLHTPYLSTHDFLHKMHHYATLFAKQNKGNKRSSFTKALSHSLFAFFRSYLLKGGIFCGKEGFIISTYNANTTFYKYLLLMEENTRLTR